MQAEARHAAAMAELHALCFDTGWPKADFQTHIERDHTFVDADTPRALLVIREGGGQAEVLTIATHPEGRGQGLARALMGEAISAITSPVLFLEVAEDNAPAIALYRSLGFERFGRRPAYYRRENGRVAALLMERRLG